MKRVLSFISVFALLLTSCTGPQGPPGFDGFDGIDGIDGQDGGLIVASAFEIEVNFNADNNFEFVEAYGFEVLPSDVTLVYIEWENDEGEPIWRLLTQTEYFDNGVLVYNYDFTQQDVRFFLDGTIDFNTLDDTWTQNQAFRVVVVPADNIDGLDTSNFDVIMNANAIKSFDIR
ncbi:collagen-like protein [Hyunsoonleella flava]|uniref:Collagen-like protein n=1 Tax=Hyunsoonleella flava TaxID=2527939 RepID=A0A4Q9FGI6_9FLAO|nr:collagen-like protein [Hyunsoonleella flava]TBN04274.1 collagen-like protein [Hyunsoonleella flava]